jgi:CheY-like chemotaxis protein
VKPERLAAIIQQYRRPTAGEGRSALVVEDDRVTRQLLRRLLEKEGWSVVEAENGRVGLERVQEECPALILLDLMMPEVDGFAFVAALRSNEACRSVPVIVITAKELSAEDRERLDGHVEQVLQKGAFRHAELLEMIRDRVAAGAERE